MNQTEKRTVDILVVGGGAGGTCAAIAAARRGAQTLLVSEFPWLGGMLTAAGVSAPDGNELGAWQTGLWGALLQQLRKRQPGGLDHNWVSLFGFSPQIGAQIFQEWVAALPNLEWIWGQTPLEVYRKGDRITGVRFPTLTVNATLTLDGTELGDLLALGEIPHRWGWEMQAEWGEPSAPVEPNPLTQRYPVQAPTWVIHLQDYGETAPEIPGSSEQDALFAGAWANHGAEKFLSYGCLPDGKMMINWPIQGNDYGVNLNRLIASPEAQLDFLQEALAHSLSFGRYIQKQLGQQYGLANQFPLWSAPGSPRSALPPEIQAGVALYPYYRESRRLKGQVTVREQDILPQSGGNVAALPRDETGVVSSVAIANYPNDHHYPGIPFSLAPKSLRWGGRWTGTPFTLPYGCLVPQAIDGFLVCEKNISVSHIANGATRLQPVVMNIGQAAGMAAALCIEHHCQPRNLSVRVLQEALIMEAIAPAAVIPYFNLTRDSPHWQSWQIHHLNHPQDYPPTGYAPQTLQGQLGHSSTDALEVSGIFHRLGEQDYQLDLKSPREWSDLSWRLITTEPTVNEDLQTCEQGIRLHLRGRINRAGGWILVEEITERLSP